MLTLLATGAGKTIVTTALLATGLSASYVAANANEHSYVMVVDGQESQVRNDATTVQEALVSRNIQLAEHDTVSPDTGAAVHAGDRIVVSYGRPLSVTVDGATRTEWVTDNRVNSALTTLKIPVEGSRVSVPLDSGIGRDGMSLSVVTPKPVTVVVDGKSTQMNSSAATVADLLKERTIAFDSNDKLNVGVDRPITRGLTVVLARTMTDEVTETEPLAHPTKTTTDASLGVGKRVVVTPGKDGAQKITYRVVVVSGKQQSKTKVSSVVVTKAVTEIVRVGPKPAPKPVTSTTGTSSDSLNWAALARCESGGNPKAVNPAGYYGLYQFSVSTWRAQGGSGLPSNASASEQTLRAKILYNRAGAGQWPVCGRKLFS